MTVRIIQGDVREELPKLPADYFDCIVTSPPYYGLRDYGTATWKGGDPACEHLSGRKNHDHSGNIGNRNEKGDAFRNSSRYVEQGNSVKSVCKCGARRVDAQIGLEPTLDAYLETIVGVCRELRRVLKPSGVFFLNIGDSYAQSGKGGNPEGSKWVGFVGNKNRENSAQTPNRGKLVYGFKPKDLCLVPERLGIALQADGWWVRSRIVWSKPNPMPESVTDRPTSAHETVWLLTKSERYFWDAEAVAEKVDLEYLKARAGGSIERTGGNGDTIARSLPTGKAQTLGVGADGKRNLRNVWTIPSHPFPGAHFATFPPALVERCIKAGSSEKGCCPACGKPWVRVVETIKPRTKSELRGKYADINATVKIGGNRSTIGNSDWHDGRHDKYINILGWQPSCKCPNSFSLPSQILDPFAGSGTVGLVADRLGRDATLIDLNTSYIDMAVNRIRDDSPLFAAVAAE